MRKHSTLRRQGFFAIIFLIATPFKKVYNNKKHLDEDFIPHLQLKGLSEEDIAGIPKEELKAYYEEYEAHMKRMK